MPTLTIKPDPAPDPSKAPEGAKGDANEVIIPDGVTPPAKEGEKGGDPPEGAGDDPNKDRPEWLPEKFKTTEDLAKAYAELEGKLGKGDGADPPAGTPEEAVAKAGLDMEAVQTEYLENGELTPETLKSFTDAGIDKATIDTFIDGQKALAEKLVSGVHEVAGGEAEYKAMLNWAQANFSPEQTAAFDKAVVSGDMELTKLAVMGMKASFDAANGKDPNLVSDTTPSKAGIKPYGSNEELVRAMRDPKYKDDPVYRKEVERRLSVTELWG